MTVGDRSGESEAGGDDPERKPWFLPAWNSETHFWQNRPAW